MIIGQHRGSFPHGEIGEPAETKRQRYERWVIDTRERITQELSQQIEVLGDDDAAARNKHLDPEWDAVMAQPAHRLDARPTARPSRKMSIRARCWQCVSGDDDEGGTRRIHDCTSRGCPLWSVRPYQPEGARVPRVARAAIKLADIPLHRQDHAGKALTHPGNATLAIKGYCHLCGGGRADSTSMREVTACPAASCALWMVRPGAEPETAADSAADPTTDQLATTDPAAQAAEAVADACEAV